MKLLIVQTGFIGDLVLSLAVISRVRSAFPGAYLAVMVTPAGADLLRGDARIDELLVYDKRGADRGWNGFKQMVRRLRTYRFTHCLTLHKSIRTTLLLALSRIPWRVGFLESSLSFLHNIRVRRSLHSHEVMRNFCIVEGLGLRVDPTDALIDLQLEQSASLKKPRERISRIAIAPGSVWRTKRWSTAGFVDLSRLLIDSGMELVLIGGPADAPVAARICSSLPAGAPVENLVGKLTLRESAKVIEAAGFLISNDTAPLHLASATGTPAVAVFCATIPEFGFTPWNIPHRIVGRRDLSCRPCGRHGGNDCPTGTHLCRRGIPASVVMAAVNELFQEIGENAA